MEAECPKIVPLPNPIQAYTSTLGIFAQRIKTSDRAQKTEWRLITKDQKWDSTQVFLPTNCILWLSLEAWNIDLPYLWASERFKGNTLTQLHSNFLWNYLRPCAFPSLWESAAGYPRLIIPTRDPANHGCDVWCSQEIAEATVAQRSFQKFLAGPPMFVVVLTCWIHPNQRHVSVEGTHTHLVKWFFLRHLCTTCAP